MVMSIRRKKHPHARRGFTVAEMLTVIGILVLLVAILIPAIGRLRRQAQGAACVANLRQLVFAYQVYAGNNDGRGPAFTFSKSDSWVEAFRSAASVDAGGTLYVCPRVGADATSGDFGTAFSSWTITLDRPGGPAQVSGSYGFNAWLLAWDPKGKAGQQFSGGRPRQYTRGAADGGERVPFFADAPWADGWPRADAPAPPDLTNGDRANQGPEKAPHENMLARFTIARHGRAINAAFAD